MGALTTNRETDRKDGFLLAVPVKGTTTIYKGAQVAIDADGYLVPATDTAGLKGGLVAYEKIDNSAGADGDVRCRVYRRGIFLFDATSITLAMVGDMMFIVDDQTFDDSVSNGVMAGRLVDYVSATKGWIDIEPASDPGVAAQAAAIVDIAASDPSVAPAGGSGATAGAYDTAGNRDLMIAAVNDNRTLTIELSTKIDAVFAALRGAGIIAQ